MNKIRQFRELIAFRAHNANNFGKIISFVHNHKIKFALSSDQQFL